MRGRLDSRTRPCCHLRQRRRSPTGRVRPDHLSDFYVRPAWPAPVDHPSRYGPTCRVRSRCPTACPPLRNPVPARRPDTRMRPGNTSIVSGIGTGTMLSPPTPAASSGGRRGMPISGRSAVRGDRRRADGLPRLRHAWPGRSRSRPERGREEAQPSGCACRPQIAVRRASSQRSATAEPSTAPSAAIPAAVIVRAFRIASRAASESGGKDHGNDGQRPSDRQQDRAEQACQAFRYDLCHHDRHPIQVCRLRYFCDLAGWEHPMMTPRPASRKPWRDRDMLSQTTS